jgi:hypothetical protein
MRCTAMRQRVILVVSSMWQDASNADAEVRRTHRTRGEGRKDGAVLE